MAKKIAKKKAKPVKAAGSKRSSAAKKTGSRPLRAAKKAGSKLPGTRRPRKAAAKPVDQAAMMAAWQKAMTPGAEHERLEPLVGSWQAKTTFVMEPNGPPQTSDGTSENRLVLGGRYLYQVYKGTSMGMPFEGIGYTGYDNIQRKYIGAWMDSFGTGLMNSIGVGKPTDKEIATEAESFDPSGKRVRFWCKLLVQDRDHHSFEMWTKAPNGRRWCMMTAEYTRT